MPTQNYDGSWTGDDGQPFDMTAATNDSAYAARPWGSNTTSGPMPAPGSYDTGGFSPSTVTQLLQQPGVRAGIAFFQAKGVRPNLNTIAAMDHQIINGYKNTGFSMEEDHSGRNALLALGAVLTAGVGSAFAGPGAGAAADAAAGAGTTGSTVPVIGSLVPATAGSGAAIASTAVPAATAAASGLPTWLSSLLKIGAPIGATVATKALTNGGGNVSGLNSDQNALLTQLIQQSAQRQQESAPVHQAAMMLAQGLAPTSSWSNSPRFQTAVQQTTGPGPAATMNPQVADAVARLMKGGT